jgi:hypothetical protein
MCIRCRTTWLVILEMYEMPMSIERTSATNVLHLVSMGHVTGMTADGKQSMLAQHAWQHCSQRLATKD